MKSYLCAFGCIVIIIFLFPNIHGVRDLAVPEEDPIMLRGCKITNTTAFLPNCLAAAALSEQKHGENTLNKKCETDCYYTATFEYDITSAWVKVELFSIFSEGYVAFGISKDEKMGDDAVAVCYADPDSGEIKVYASSNVGRRNVPVSSQTDVTKIRALKVNGGIYCKIGMSTGIKVDHEVYNWSPGSLRFHLLLAGSSSKVEDDKIRFHDARVASAPWDLTNFTLELSPRDDGPERIHAGYMMFVWMVWIPIAVFVSRFYKESFTDTVIMGHQLWFIIHTTCTFFAAIMAFTGYLVLIYDREDWIPPQKPEYFHGVIGGVAIILLFIQSIFGWLQPKPGSGVFLHRSYGKLHFIMGIACFALGAYNVVMAPLWTFNVLPCIMGPIAMIWYGIYILLTLIMTFYVCWTDWHLGIGGMRAFVSCPMPVASKEEAARPKLRKTMLVTVVVLAILFAFVAIVSLQGSPCLHSKSLTCNIWKDE